MAATAFGKPYKKTSCTPSHKSAMGSRFPGSRPPLFKHPQRANGPPGLCGGSLGLAMPSARQEDDDNDRLCDYLSTRACNLLHLQNRENCSCEQRNGEACEQWQHEAAEAEGARLSSAAAAHS